MDQSSQCWGETMENGWKWLAFCIYLIIYLMQNVQDISHISHRNRLMIRWAFCTARAEIQAPSRRWIQRCVSGYRLAKLTSDFSTGKEQRDRKYEEWHRSLALHQLLHIAICLSFLHWVHANCLHLLVLSFSSSPVLMQFDCMHLKTYTVWFIYSNFYNQFCNHDSGSGIGKNMFIDTRQPPPRRPPPPPPPREGATLCQICTCTCTYIQI